MKKLFWKYRVLAGGALFAAAVTYVSGCCCPCGIPLPTDLDNSFEASAPMAPKVLPKLKDFKATSLGTSVQAVHY